MPTSERRTDDLTAYLEALTDAVDAGADTRTLRQPARRWPAALAGAAAAAVLVGALVTLVADGEDRRTVDAVDQTTPDDPGVPDAAPPVPGEWRPLDDRLPVADMNVATFWTGTSLVAVYPENEGNDVAVQVWDENLENPRIGSRSNLPWRTSPTIVWTGTEVLIIGGSNGPGIERPAVAYNPAADRWRDLAAPPGFQAGSSNAGFQHGRWTGNEVVFPADGLAYRPQSDSWHELPAAPAGTVRPGGAVVVTDSHVIVWGGCPGDVTNDVCESERLASGRGAAFDLQDRTWEEIPAGGPVPGAEVHGVWTGSEVVLVSTRTGFDSPTGTVAAYDPTAGTWRSLPDPPFETSFRTRLVATPSSKALPTGVVLIGEGMPAATFDLGSGTWRRLGNDSMTTGSAAAWADGRLAVVGGSFAFQPAK